MTAFLSAWRVRFDVDVDVVEKIAQSRVMAIHVGELRIALHDHRLRDQVHGFNSYQWASFWRALNECPFRSALRPSIEYSAPDRPGWIAVVLKDVERTMAEDMRLQTAHADAEQAKVNRAAALEKQAIAAATLAEARERFQVAHIAAQRADAAVAALPESTK